MTQIALLAYLPLALPLLHLLIAALGVDYGSSRLTQWLSSAGLGTALLSALAAFALGDNLPVVALISSAAASHLLAVLVGFLGLVISTFARNYLAGDSGRDRFFRMLHLTLAAVATLAVTDNLVIFLLAWLAVSLALNELLLFYADRPRARLAAHKKYLCARCAELALLIAFFLLYQQHGTLQISVIAAAYPASLSLSEQTAVVLLALAALIKCAQLPLHGWLIQVVEAPTPVSALLHAGIINLGGFLLILFAPLLMSSPVAQGLILVVAGLSATLASLIMTTRVSIKVKLAWSTVAQMGLMLVQCALGLFDLAMLHLLAHACYKAYCFLRSGSAVQHYLGSSLQVRRQASPVIWAVSAAVALSGSYLAAQFFAPAGPISPWLLLAAFLMVALVEFNSIQANKPPAVALALALVLFCAYLSQKTLLSAVVGIDLALPAVGLADLWVACLTALLFIAWQWLRVGTDSPLRRTVHTWLFAGLYLDEWMTRTTLRLWPLSIPLPRQHRRKRAALMEGE